MWMASIKTIVNNTISIIIHQFKSPSCLHLFFTHTFLWPEISVFIVLKFADFMIVKREAKILISLIRTLHSGSKTNGLRAKLDGNLLVVIKNEKGFFLLVPAVRISKAKPDEATKNLKFKILGECPHARRMFLKLKAASGIYVFLPHSTSAEQHFLPDNHRSWTENIYELSTSL